jgi:hypothetical protein
MELNSCDNTANVQDLTHDQIAEIGAKWLSRHGYKYVFSNMRSQFSSENPDALGLKGGFSDAFVLEVKVSRSDFLADKKKTHRQLGKGVGLHYAYLTPKGLIDPLEVPYGWQLLEIHGKTKPKIVVVKGKKRYGSNVFYENTNAEEMRHFVNHFLKNTKDDSERKQSLLSWLCTFFDRLHESDIDLSDIGNGKFVHNRTSYKDQEIEKLKAKILFLEKQNNEMSRILRNQGGKNGQQN